MTTELSITGVLPQDLYAAAISRLRNFSESGESFALDEEVFARAGPAVELADTLGASAGQFVRVKALRRSGRGGGAEAEWTIQINQRPEPPRTAPRALQHGVVEFAFDEGADPRMFVSALGFDVPVFKIFQRGVRFKRGALLVEVSQLFESADASSPLDPSSYSITASTRFSAPARSGTTSGTASSQQQTGPSAQDIREAALASVEQVKMLLKGLTDLSRVD